MSVEFALTYYQQLSTEYAFQNIVFNNKYDIRWILLLREPTALI